jgi:hypothetical protein
MVLGKPTNWPNFPYCFYIGKSKGIGYNYSQNELEIVELGPLIKSAMLKQSLLIP